MRGQIRNTLLSHYVHLSCKFVSFPGQPGTSDLHPGGRTRGVPPLFLPCSLPSLASSLMAKPTHPTPTPLLPPLPMCCSAVTGPKLGTLPACTPYESPPFTRWLQSLHLSHWVWTVGLCGLICCPPSGIQGKRLNFKIPNFHLPGLR